jgi:DNA-binding PadR family transcriptional regulator
MMIAGDQIRGHLEGLILRVLEDGPAHGFDVLRRLEERGLVKREPSPLDGRQKLATISAKGTRIMNEMYDSMREAQVRFMEPLSAKERTEFVRMMMALVEGNNQYGRTSLKHFD